MTPTQSDPNGRPLSRRVLLAGLAAVALLAAHPAGAVLAVDGEPKAFIQSLGDRTIEILQTDASQQEKLSSLKSLLDKSADLDLIARLVLGRHWRTATPEQQAEYTRLFDQLVMQTMAERMSWYTGQTFEIVDAKPVDERDTMVETRIIRPGGAPPIKVDWRVRKSDGGHQLIDIVAEGVSLVVTQRSEANEIVGRGGIEGLLAEMRNRLDRQDGVNAPI